MKTSVKNWSVITIDDELSPFTVLWAIVENDERGRFEKGDYVCTSRILYAEGNHVRTHTGSTYELIGLGSEYKADFSQLLQLRSGFSPQEICE
jgi:hypothetical protein